MIVGQMQLRDLIQAMSSPVIHSTMLMHMKEELAEWVLSHFLDTILEKLALKLRDLKAAWAKSS